MAAYAAVVSLMHVIHNIQNHSRFSIYFSDKQKSESLGEKLDFFLKFIESNHSDGGSEEDKDLESQIARAAHAAEDVIESYAVNLIHTTLISLLDQPFTQSLSMSRIVDKGSTQLSDILTKRQLSLQIIPIFGVHTIRSSVLARLEYINQFDLKNFDIRAWATVGQEYNLENIFSEVLYESSQSADEQQLAQQQLAQQMYQSLIGRKYLIVLDDICSIDAWEKMMFFFPDNNNGSLIIITTEMSNVAVHFGWSDFRQTFFDEDKFWKLSSEKTFPQEGFPSEDIKREATNPMSPWGQMFGLEKVIQEMDLIKNNVIKIKEKRRLKEQQPTYSLPATSSTPLIITGKSAGMVGFEKDLLQLMEGLTGQQSALQIIPIVGMGGIGKTTLARNVYENPYIDQHFNICAWVTLSQEYSVRKILLELLSCQGKSTSEMDGKDEAQLGEQLHKSLSGRRYLIVLDDIWSTDAWEKINHFLPKMKNRSRVVVTTRLLEVANHLGSSCHTMSFLDEDKSWELFCQKAFGQEGNCPPELEGIGKEIVKECKGLPLSIVIIGGLLGKSIKTQEYWKKFAKDKKIILNSGVGCESLDILSLSYNHLPAHLKPCFLYMGVFPEDHVISVSRLIKLWVAEGFIKPNTTQSLEESAEGYLKDLVDRNLVLVRRLGLTGKMKTCTIHDLLRELCLKVAQNEKFLCVTSVPEVPLGIDKRQRIRIFHALVSTLLDGSNLVSKGGKLSLKVLHLVDSDSSLQNIFEQINLRYVCKSYSLGAGSATLPRLPPSIFWNWNLQTLIIRGKETFTAPPQIWMMRQLRHFEFDEIYLEEPPPSGDLQTTLPNLQTFFRIVNLELSEELCMTIPNVKKLKLKYGDFSAEKYHLYNLDLLHKLESLSCFFPEAPKWGDLMQNLKFPSSLKKLSLRNCNLRWEDLTVIGSLPHLEVLKLMGLNSVVGNEWNPVEREFIRLKFLGIYYCYDLMHWNADRSHFPVLENLVFEGLSKLDEIPFGIGEIPTLGLIELDGCRESAAISAVRILEEHERFGNEGLQVRVKLLDNETVERFVEKMKEEFGSFTSGNFQLRAINRFS